jgi:hypothetical protein
MVCRCWHCYSAGLGKIRESVTGAWNGREKDWVIAKNGDSVGTSCEIGKKKEGQLREMGRRKVVCEKDEDKGG